MVVAGYSTQLTACTDCGNQRTAVKRSVGQVALATLDVRPPSVGTAAKGTGGFIRLLHPDV
jgi:hypothetical protein